MLKTDLKQKRFQFAKYLFWIFPIIFAIIPVALEAEENEIPVDFFKGIELTRPAPKIFLVGETYIFQGRIADFSQSKEVVIQINPPGEQIFEFYYKSENGSFSIPVTFEKEGISGLTIRPRYRSTTSVLITVLPPPENQHSKPHPITSFLIHHQNIKSSLKWTSENNLFKIEFQQNEIFDKVIVSGNIKEFDLTPGFFYKFKTGKMTARIFGAVSEDGSLYRKSSPWSGSRKLEFYATEHIPMDINENKIIELEGVDHFVKPRTGIKIRGKSFDKYFDKVKVIKPDLRVDEIPVESSGIAQKYSTGNLFPEDSYFMFSYYFAEKGTYILQLNNQEGETLLKIPVYVGDIHPILPGYLERSENDFIKFVEQDIPKVRQNILNQVNRRRQTLSLSALEMNEDLNSFAQSYAVLLKQTGKIGHRATNQGALKYRKRKANIKFILSENLALAETPLLALESLFRSPSHYKELIDPDARLIGIGLAESNDGKIILVQHIAPGLFSQSKKEKVINQIIKGLNENRKTKLKRVFTAPEKNEKNLSFGPVRISSLEMLKKLVFRQSYVEIINKENQANAIYITRFDQEANGFYFGFIIAKVDLKE